MISLTLVAYDFIQYVGERISGFIGLNDLDYGDEESEWEFRFGGGGWNGWREIDIGDWDNILLDIEDDIRSESGDSGVEKDLDLFNWD